MPEVRLGNAKPACFAALAQCATCPASQASNKFTTKLPGRRGGADAGDNAGLTLELCHVERIHQRRCLHKKTC